METHAFVGRITRPYSDLSGMFIDWAGQCESLWVYEHTADEKVNNTHCHLLIFGSQRDADGLKKRVSWKTVGVVKGNTGSSFKKYDSKYGMEFLTYMTKGKLKPAYCSGVEVESKAEEARLKWVDKKEETKKEAKKRVKGYYDIAMEVKEQLHYVPVLKQDSMGVHTVMTIASSEDLYDKLVQTLNKYKIRTSEYDLDRWVCTIIRDDPFRANDIKARIKAKYSF